VNHSLDGDTVIADIRKDLTLFWLRSTHILLLHQIN